MQANVTLFMGVKPDTGSSGAKTCHGDDGNSRDVILTDVDITAVMFVVMAIYIYTV